MCRNVRSKKSAGTPHLDIPNIRAVGHSMTEHTTDVQKGLNSICYEVFIHWHSMKTCRHLFEVAQLSWGPPDIFWWNYSYGD